MRGVIAVVLAVAAVSAWPSFIQVDSAIQQLDRRVCSDEIIQTILTASETAQGKAAGCNRIVEMVFNGDRPKYDKMCECSKFLDFALSNVYDNKHFDCVVRVGSWNVMQVSQDCRVTELANQSKLSSSASVVTSNVSCVQNTTCFHGKCVDNVCKCDEGTGNLRWEPVHPLYVGPECAVLWCPDDCSGHGTCNVMTGGCMCDSTYVGDACSEPHHETLVTNGIPPDPLPDVSADAAKEWKDPSNSPSPSPSPSLDFEVMTIPAAPTDPCAYILCGPNGYCDPTVTPVQCICIGGFSGTNCLTPPESSLESAVAH